MAAAAAAGVGAGAQSLLVLVLDTSPAAWVAMEQEHGLKLADALEHHINVFINSHLTLNLDNSVAVIASHPGCSAFLYPSDAPVEAEQDTGKLEQLADVDATVAHGLAKLLADSKGSANAEGSALAAALSRALCYIHKQRLQATKLDLQLTARILVVSVSSPSPEQYVPIMNTIFAADKEGVMIDGCVLRESNAFLQQAARLTRAVYMEIPRPPALLQYLLSLFLADGETRACLSLPQAPQVDLRASCFCHKTTVDTAFVCSVCLSIYCRFKVQCDTCKTLFKLPTATTSTSQSSAASAAASKTATAAAAATPAPP